MHVSNVDSGLFYSSLSPSRLEWKQTFPGKEDEYGPLHLWAKCIRNEVRTFFFIEKLSEGLITVSARESRVMVHSLITFLVDGERMSVALNGGGGEFKVKISRRDRAGCLHIGVDNWLHFACMPMTQCVDSVHATSARSIVMNLFTWDEKWTAATAHSFEPSILAVEKHFLYHRCAFNISKYEVVIQEDALFHYASNDVLRDASQRGLLEFKLKGNHPPPLDGKTPQWQAIYENLALLQHWQENVRILLWDPDEFLFVDPTRFAEYSNIVDQHDKVILFDRVEVLCVDCADKDKGGAADVYHPFSQHRYKKRWNAMSAPKMMVNPDSVGCMYVHKAYNDGGQSFHMDSRVAYIYHFENFFVKRNSAAGSEWVDAVVSPFDMANGSSSCRFPEHAVAAMRLHETLSPNREVEEGYINNHQLVSIALTVIALSLVVCGFLYYTCKRRLTSPRPAAPLLDAV